MGPTAPSPPQSRWASTSWSPSAVTGRRRSRRSTLRAAMRMSSPPSVLHPARRRQRHCRHDRRPTRHARASSPSEKPGLDYYYEHSRAQANSARSFAEHRSQLAHEHDLTLVVHTRDAWDETFEILDAEGVPERTIFHCFTGGADEAATRGLERGIAPVVLRHRDVPESASRRAGSRIQLCPSTRGFWSKPTARTSLRSRTAASRIGPRGCPMSASSSPTCAMSPSAASPPTLRPIRAGCCPTSPDRTTQIRSVTDVAG